MDDQPLAAMLGASLRDVAELEARDQAGRAYADVQTRLAYLHTLLNVLATELEGFRNEASSTPACEALWRETTAELRETAPATLRSPASALIAGDLDLLKLVEYTSASIARVQERRLLTQRLAHGAANPSIARRR